ncbi:NAD(+) synthase [Pacificimonas flava]|uniref:Glutamine-dependent NAD(+) synthetase n=2 Tax=Pacificimonas TaxID=1960290 RepID=A0A219B3H9_9SPHN|nr:MULTISPECIES: NAD(+) synthase [Pacificimonas]MBZ6377411.1 NAD(+) synthase [Pacificimonas aurantium]OWV32885.1 NAD(+) synthase [Pacificimonas flava]
MATQHPFHSLGRQGFVRIACATPLGTVGDISENEEAHVTLARDAHDQGVDLLLFPELSISSYALDDLHLQEALLDRVEGAVASICEATAKLRPVIVAGATLRRADRLYNCALAIQGGRVLGVVPKSFLPNYREYYEKRWFAPGAGLTGLSIDVAGEAVPFGTDLMFRSTVHRDFSFGIEICEDFWAPVVPSTAAALAGAHILCNLSGSNVTIGKSRDRKLLAAAQSARTMSIYAFSACGPGESTTDMAWDGQGFVYELGDLLKESTRFDWHAQTLICDVDVQRIRLERMRTPTFNDAGRALDAPTFRTVEFTPAEDEPERRLDRPLRRFPFVPNDPEKLDEDCYEAFNIQVEGLAKRYQSTGGDKLVIGISGGLDSTHALIVAAKAFDRLGIDRKNILGFTMPGFGTSDRTKSNAHELMSAMGITAEEIDIRPSARDMLEKMGHPFAEGEPVYDLTFENVQAGLRTDYLFRLAGQRSGFVVGTGDLSELALGWCTYGVGDQMSHYNVNAGVPKTLIQHLIRWCVSTDQFDEAAGRVLTDILGTEISPELVPAGEDGEIQSTEDKIGPYALHDFFLFYTLRYGLPPSKIAYMAWHAWRDAEAGSWPQGIPEDARPEYDLATIRKWLEVFAGRYFGFAQFKRSALPNGPKVSWGGSLSPRADWRAPSDGTAKLWLEELGTNVPETG